MSDAIIKCALDHLDEWRPMLLLYLEYEIESIQIADV